MRDLNSTIFYKAKFTISCQKDIDDLLWNFILKIREWITKKFNKENIIVIDPAYEQWSKFKMGKTDGRFFDQTGENRLYAESELFVKKNENSEKEEISWACQIVENQKAEDRYAPRKWVTEIGYQSYVKDKAEISYVVSYSDRAGYIGELQPEPELSLPKLIRFCLTDKKYECFIEETKLRYDPVELKIGEFPTFWDFLCSKKRALPVVYISPRYDYDEGETKLLISPEKMARSVAGNALVYYSRDMGFSDEMKYCIKEKYGCSNGAVRIYQKNMDVEDEGDSYRHRFLLPKMIQEKGETEILKIFRRALAQDIEYYEKLFRLETCVHLKKEQGFLREKEQYREKIKNASEFEQVVEELYGELDDNNNNLIKERDRLKKENDRLKAENSYNEIQRECLQDKVKELEGIKLSYENVRNIEKYPSTAKEIAQFFERVYPERIAFTDRAYKSLENCNKKKEILWQGLYSIVTVLYNLFQKGSKNPYDEYTDNTEWTCSRGNGRQTNSNRNLQKNYIDEYKGQQINIEVHIKKGSKDKNPNSMRIYFCHDVQISEKIIIGHCGDHIDNASTQRIK